MPKRYKVSVDELPEDEGPDFITSWELEFEDEDVESNRLEMAKKVIYNLVYDFDTGVQS